jgi:hypothetical protein
MGTIAKEVIAFLYLYTPEKQTSKHVAWFGSSYPDKPLSNITEACQHASSCIFYYTSECQVPWNDLLWQRGMSFPSEREDWTYTVPIKKSSCGICLGNPEAVVQCHALDPSLFSLSTSPSSLYEIYTTAEPREFIIVYDVEKLEFEENNWKELHALFGTQDQEPVFQKQFSLPSYQSYYLNNIGKKRIYTSRQSLITFGMKMCQRQEQQQSSGYFDTKDATRHRECQAFYKSLSPSEQDEVMQEICRENPEGKECKCYHRHDEKDYQKWEHAVPNSRDAQCWYQPCTDTSRYFIPSELRSTSNCPTLNCQNVVINGGEGDNVQIWKNKIQQSVHCTFPSSSSPPILPPNPQQQCEKNEYTMLQKVKYVGLGILLSLFVYFLWMLLFFLFSLLGKKKPPVPLLKK